MLEAIAINVHVHVRKHEKEKYKDCFVKSENYCSRTYLRNRTSKYHHFLWETDLICYYYITYAKHYIGTNI